MPGLLSRAAFMLREKLEVERVLVEVARDSLGRD